MLLQSSVPLTSNNHQRQNHDLQKREKQKLEKKSCKNQKETKKEYYKGSGNRGGKVIRTTNVRQQGRLQ